MNSATFRDRVAMNKTEKEMTLILEELKNEFGAISVKAEFEAEGTRMDELLRLVEISRAAQLSLTVKIGGCEAIRDLLEAKQIGVQYIVAPMVETSYAASKFLAAKNFVYDSIEREDVKFLINIETETAFSNLEEITKTISKNEGLDGVVFGRVDYVGSKGLPRGDVDSPEILEVVNIVASHTKESGLELVVGGGISANSVEFLRETSKINLDRFETRKIVFSGKSLNNSRITSGLLSAVKFELLWLQNKRDYYGKIHREDEARISMLENRWKVL